MTLEIVKEKKRQQSKKTLALPMLAHFPEQLLANVFNNVLNKPHVAYFLKHFRTALAYATSMSVINTLRATGVLFNHWRSSQS